ncbi:hypothetical protein GCM10023063_16650 [Arthrobacter methylotrophus]|uniref:Cbb3-type cytochrome c oxidase subunit 3 n=1 Tax=Arthrobacter methylotrophus TaxID=121291 RepID=A0ABV5UNI6_9MICC
MTSDRIETILVAAGVASAFMTFIVIAYVVVSRRSAAELDRLRAEYEAGSAPYYAALIRSGRATVPDQPSETPNN